MQEKFKEPRIYLSLAILIAGFFPWMKVTSGVKVAKASAEASVGITGYQTFSYSFLGILIFIIPLALLVLEFAPQIKIKLSAFYIVGALVGIVISIILFFVVKSSAANAGSAVSGAGISASAEVKASMHIGFWLIMILFLALAIYTLIKDYALSKNILKEKGLKGAISDITGSVKKELSENVSSVATSSGIAGMTTNTCPQCGASVLKGKKFCMKCGAKMPESEERQTVERHVSKGQKVSTMMTVNEYIQSLKAVICEKCGESVPSTSKFCLNCGETLIIRQVPEKCSCCGGSLVKGKKYCPDCGNEVITKVLKTKCIKCNSELIYGKKFCVECGTKVEE